MIYLDLRLDDVGKDQWMYSLISMDKRHHFTLTLPLEEMGVLERHNMIGKMLARAWEQEQHAKLNERPREGAEDYLGIDIEWEEEEEDNEP